MELLEPLPRESDTKTPEEVCRGLSCSRNVWQPCGEVPAAPKFNCCLSSILVHPEYTSITQDTFRSI